MANYVRSPELLSRSDSRLLVVDVQERLVPHMSESDQLIKNCRKLIEGAGILNVPVAATEQYPKGLGNTVPELIDLLPDRPEKVRFSCAETLEWAGSVLSNDEETTRDKVVVVGIESHVCVLQTVMDLLAGGYRVFVPADAVTSRTRFDWEVALRRMSDAGATICTTESVLFEWCEVAGSPEFKQISKLVVG